MVHELIYSSDSLAASLVFGGLALVLLIYCAEKAVQKVLALLNILGLSATFGGLTIFSITTSFPEIFAHLIASLGIVGGTLDYKIASATVLGANIGSDVIQQTLILGIVVFLMGGLTFKKDFLVKAYLPMIGTTLMTLVLGWDRTLSRMDGAILFGTFIAYMIFIYHMEDNRKKNTKLKTKKEGKKQRIASHHEIVRNVRFSLMAFMGMLFSAHVLLISVENIVHNTNLGGSLIGVISLGIAAATPELLTAIAGLKQKAAGISLGTLIGSNITNPLVAIGGGALISTYWVPDALVLWDLPMETITAAMLLVYLIFTKGKLGRLGAFYLIGLYAAYLGIRFLYFSVD